MSYQVFDMSYVNKSELVNEDAVTCAIYFNKLVNCLIKMKHYFKRIEFQHRGSLYAHILLQLDNAPNDLISDSNEVIEMVDNLVSVSESEASGNIKLQAHKHTFTGFKKINPAKKNNCRFGAPFCPSVVQKPCYQ